jgi:hypothetical protein
MCHLDTSVRLRLPHIALRERLLRALDFDLAY